MRIKAGQHAVDCLFDQTLVIHIFDVVALDATKHFGQHAHFFNRQVEYRALLFSDGGKIKAQHHARNGTDADQSGSLHFVAQGISRRDFWCVAHAVLKLNIFMPKICFNVPPNSSGRTACPRDAIQNIHPIPTRRPRIRPTRRFRRSAFFRLPASTNCHCCRRGSCSRRRGQ